MDESLEGLLWLISVLEGSASITAALPGGVWPLQAPEGTPPPYATISYMGGHDVNAIAGYRLFHEGVYQVRVWGYATQIDTLKTAGDTADTLLQQAAHRITPDATAEVMSCIRDNPLPMQPDFDGQQLRIGVGGMYRLQVRSL